MFFCSCLNVQVNVAEAISESNGHAHINSLKLIAVPAMSDMDHFEAYEFLKSSFRPVKGTVQVQHSALVLQRKVDKWTVNHCINCDCYVYATGDGVNEDILLVNQNLMHDEAELLKLKNCDTFSKPFKVILKPIDALPAHISLIENPRVKALFGKLQDFIDHDEMQTEAEIRRLSSEKNARRMQAEKDFQRMVTLFESTCSTADSTKTMSSEDVELTPPVTPESINDKMMSIENQLPQPMIINKIKQRDGLAKHNNAIHQQHITRTIDFDDDIFQIEEEMKTDPDHYHKYSDTEEDSDGDRVVEKRPNRGRSGSINIARSAPISMPQFNHHVIHQIEDEKIDNDQMDIASSIQMLARSVHADSVFGELPTRPTMRYNKNEY